MSAQTPCRKFVTIPLHGQQFHPDLDNDGVFTPDESALIMLCLSVNQLILPFSTQDFQKIITQDCFHFTCHFHIFLGSLADTGTKCQQLHR